MFVQASKAAEVTGLTEHQIKEWCIRRSLLRPDRPPAGRGHHALFGWRTLLALRLLRELHEEFGGTVAYWAPILSQWRDDLVSKPFHSLYEHSVILEKGVARISRVIPNSSSMPFIVLPLNHHLVALAAGGLAAMEKQRPLLKPHLVKR